MKILTDEQIKKLGISSRATFDKMVKLGWIDGLGRQLSWSYWQRLGSKEYARQ